MNEIERLKSIDVNGAIAQALREKRERESGRAQPENEPLTLSQLYDIDNEPLYFHCTVGIWSLNGWHIVKAINYDGAQFKDVQLDNNDAHIESLYNYGKTWLAYRHKPAKEDSDA